MAGATRSLESSAGSSVPGVHTGMGSGGFAVWPVSGPGRRRDAEWGKCEGVLQILHIGAPELGF